MLQVMAYQVFRGPRLLHTVLDVVDDAPLVAPAAHPLDVGTLLRVSRELVG